VSSEVRERLAALAADLAALGELRRDEPMSRHTTFGIGGPADLFFRATGRQTLAGAVRAARRRGVALTILGSGSNVLVGDRGIRGLVVVNEARAITSPDELPEGSFRVIGESGASFASTARRLCRAGYAGLEWAVGIPGTLGGAVVYNAGAYGGQLADALTAIDVLDLDGAERTLPAAELHLEYRSSAFTRGLLADRVVLAVEFRVRRDEDGAALAVIARNDQKRLAAQPRGRNAGSMFKNPPGDAAWRLIDAVGLRGARAGDAEISTKHANFFTNAGHATAAEMKTLIDLAHDRVLAQFGVDLHTEVALLGEGF
jgi:UDP-N-acetylmuramate dehydrogenase